jgi:hypothetical protein
MWYVSGNRDEEMFENADDFVIERRNARNHIAFGFGVHRCLGLRGRCRSESGHRWSEAIDPHWNWSARRSSRG